MLVRVYGSTQSARKHESRMCCYNLKLMIPTSGPLKTRMYNVTRADVRSELVI